MVFRDSQRHSLVHPVNMAEQRDLVMFGSELTAKIAFDGAIHVCAHARSRPRLRNRATIARAHFTQATAMPVAPNLL
jgi:hypothetical protein